MRKSDIEERMRQSLQKRTDLDIEESGRGLLCWPQDRNTAPLPETGEFPFGSSWQARSDSWAGGRGERRRLP